MASPAERHRLRDLGIRIGRFEPGNANAITDVDGVRVGHTTLVSGEGPLLVGRGPVRTGVTVILPHAGNVGADPVFAGCHVLNGNGEMTGLVWLRESGLLTTPIAITNTHSVGVVRDALISYNVQQAASPSETWSLPVVAETYDGFLNDINGMHVRPEHVYAALDDAAGGVVAEGSVGGGTGMISHGFKGGIGTSSRVLPAEHGGYTVGVLVQANHGRRSRLRVDGVAVGEVLGPNEVPLPGVPQGEGSGSIIVVVATDAPLLPMQCDRLAQRSALGVGRVGGLGENSSGDIMLAFSTANHGLQPLEPTTTPITVQMLANDVLSPLYEAVVDATEEAILNAMCMATSMTGINGHTVYALPLERLRAIMERTRP
jgi:D-aminopeptidase